MTSPRAGRSRVVKPHAVRGNRVAYGRYMTRAAGLRSVLVCAAGWLAAATAHENQKFHLAGATFCVDPASAHVSLDLPRPQRTASARKVLKGKLLKMLEATLSRSQVSYRVSDRCADARDYTLLVADIRYLDPKTYVGFGNQAYNYNLFLQVGSYDNAVSVQLTQQLPTDRFNAFVSEIYAEGDEGKPFEPFVVGEGSKLVQGLTAYWWEDNPRKSLRARLLSPLLGGALALLSGVTAWWVLRRRGVSEQPRHSSSG